MPAAAFQASAGIVGRSVVDVMTHMPMMMVMMRGRVMMDGGRSRTSNQRRHADNDGQGRENFTHQRLQNEQLQ